MSRMMGLGVFVALCALMSVAALAQGNLPQAVQLAVADLSQRTGVPAEQIAVVSLEEVTWPDTSLGNPQPGMFYAQVLTPGYRVVLDAADQRYEYHTDRGTQFSFVGAVTAAPAPDGLEPAPREHDEVLTRLEMIGAAKSDLARRLGIAVGAVYLASVEAETWPDASLGFPRPDALYQPQPTPGYRLIFETAEAGLSQYHTDLTGRVVAWDATVVGGGAPPPAQGGAGAVDDAVADLAGRLAISPEDVTVLDVSEVRWPDGSLGLPEPGMVYTKAIVRGLRIVLGALDRAFEYHSAMSGGARYAGVVYPDDPRISVLHLARVEPIDGNNFFDLRRVSPTGTSSETVVPLISDFAATPDGRDIAVVRRESRSGHMLGVLQPGGELAVWDRAMDFGGLAWDETGSWLAYWRRPGVGQPPALFVRARWWDGNRPVNLPGFEPGSFVPGKLAWTSDGLTITIHPAASSPQTFFWNGEQATSLGFYEVLCWIPRTRALVARSGPDQLVTLIPGMGETPLVRGANITSVASPSRQQRLVAVRSRGDGGLDLVSMTWGGQLTNLASMTGASAARVEVSPVGNIATVHYQMGDEEHTDILRLGDTAQQLMNIAEPGPALPVAD